MAAPKWARPLLLPLVGHSKAFRDAVDWGWAKDLATFEKALAKYKELRPIPGCLAAPR